MIPVVPNDWAALNWLTPVTLVALFAIAVVVWSYFISSGSSRLKWTLGFLKIAAIILLAICLLEPVHRYSRPEPGANLILVMADDSQSLQIKDRGQSKNRESILTDLLDDDANWLNQLNNEFDVRRYLVDQQLRPVFSFAEYAANRRGSNLIGNIELASSRFSGRPAAGILLFTDGNATDANEIESRLQNLDWNSMPPIYPVVIGNERPAKDLAITRVSSTQTNFESAPVTITAELMAHGYVGKSIHVQLLGPDNEEIERQTVDRIEDGRAFAIRFKTKPAKRGVNVFHVRAFTSEDEKRDDDTKSDEATIVNNQRTLIVNRGRGPFRVLYVTGRPNWELKFLRRAIQADEEVDMVALVRIARREAKFSFRGREGQQSNPLFRGFASQDDDTAEQHDEPVFLRLGTKDENELRDGFPKDAETLFEYDAVVLDDVESAFFSEEQKSLLQKFVSLRGGGLLMLGGQESFKSGNYDRTPIGEMMPVYLDDATKLPEESYQLNLTRDGWLQPWVRVASTETDEKKRLQAMPNFKTVNLSQTIKPGATVLASIESASGDVYPALVVQSFGKGKTAALLIGDWWRWHLKTEADNDDLMMSWRQTIRWLVSDVPRRVEAISEPIPDSNQSVQIAVDVRDENYKPFDNATIEIEVATPDKTIQLTARPIDDQPGRYAATFAARLPGAYRATVTAAAADGSEIERRETGWVADPDADEFQSLVPNRELMEMLAQRSGGEVIDVGSSDGTRAMQQFVDSLPNRKVPITETRTLPWWHRWTIFSIAIALLVVEWGVRRLKGLS